MSALKGYLLLAEDEKNIATGLIYNLKKNGFEVDHAPDGTAALSQARSQPYDLIILDVMMPGHTGFEVCKTLRDEKILTPILMLTARHELENRVKGFKLGADDYLGKPFSMDELLVRIEALLRRKVWDISETKTPEKPTATIHKIGSLIFNPEALTLSTVNSSEDRPPLQLTAIETKLLQFLVSDVGKIFPRAEILEKVWGLKAETQTRTLDNFIMRLRHHFEAVGGSGDWIESVRGVGYRLNT